MEEGTRAKQGKTEPGGMRVGGERKRKRNSCQCEQQQQQQQYRLAEAV